ncbi:hypothetical protein GCM10009590_33590 [Brachybacterium alimentarium]
MKAPGTARRRAVLSDMRFSWIGMLSFSTIRQGGAAVDPSRDTGSMFFPAAFDLSAPAP